MSRFAAPIAEQIWDMKYRFKQADGTPIDQTVEDSWRRIARDLARVENDQAQWEEKFWKISNTCLPVGSRPGLAPRGR